MVDKKYGKKQVPLDITELRSDYEVFERLNEVYGEHRGKWRALTKLQKLRLTKVRPTLVTAGSKVLMHRAVVSSIHPHQCTHPIRPTKSCHHHARRRR